MNLVTMVLACSLYPDNSITNAMVEIGSQNNPLTITVTDNGQSTTKNFKTEAAALAYANTEIAQGYTINIGLLQIPNTWIAKYPPSMGASVAGLLRPCKNMVVATDLLNDATEQCASVDGDKTACALSVFHTGSPTAGLDYAKQIMAYAVANPFVKPPSILEQVPASSDNANTTNTADTSMSTSPESSASNNDANSSSPNNDVSTTNSNNSDQQSSSQNLNNELSNDDATQSN